VLTQDIYGGNDYEDGGDGGAVRGEEFTRVNPGVGAAEGGGAGPSLDQALAPR